MHALVYSAAAAAVGFVVGVRWAYKEMQKRYDALEARYDAFRDKHLDDMGLDPRAEGYEALRADLEEREGEDEDPP